VSPTLTEWQNAVAYRHLRDVVDEFDVVHAYNMELPGGGRTTDRTSAATVATLNSYHFLPKSVSNTSRGRPNGSTRPSPIRRQGVCSAIS